MSPVVIAASTPTSLQQTYPASTPALAVGLHANTKSMVPHAGSLLASFTRSGKGLFESAQPVSFLQGVAPVHSPAPYQNPWPSSSDGLGFFAGLILVVGLVTCTLMLVSKCWGRREQRKAIEKAKADEEAQANVTEAENQAELKVSQEKMIIDKVADNDDEKQITIGKSDSIVDIKNYTDKNISHTRALGEEDIVTFYYADYAHITDPTFSGELNGRYSTVDGTSSPSSLIEAVSDSDKEHPREATNGEPCVSSDTAATGCQPSSFIAEEEDITDAIGSSSLVDEGMSMVSLSSVDVNHRSSSEDITKQDNGESALDLLITVLREVQEEDLSTRLDDGVSILCCVFLLPYAN